MELVASHLVGLAFARYQLSMEGLPPVWLTPCRGEADMHPGHSDCRRLAPRFLTGSTAQEAISPRRVIKATVHGVPTLLAGPAGCGQGPPAGWRSTAAAVGLAANRRETVVRPGEPAARAMHQHGADPATLGQSNQPRGEPRPRCTHIDRIARVFDTMALEPVHAPASSASQRAGRVGVSAAEECRLVSDLRYTFDAYG